MAAAAGGSGSSPLFFPSATEIIAFGNFDKSYEIDAAQKMAGVPLVKKEELAKVLANRVSLLEFLDPEHKAKIIDCFNDLAAAVEKAPQNFKDKARFPDKKGIILYAAQKFQDGHLIDGEHELINRVASAFANKDACISKEEVEEEVKKFAEEYQALDCRGVAKFFTGLSDHSIDEFEKIHGVSVGGKATTSAAAEPTEEK
jgi:hypothetical protein